MNQTPAMNTCSELTYVIADALRVLDGLTREQAMERARAIVMKAAQLGYGGSTYHLHTVDNLRRDEIAARVRAEYNGRNVPILARRYGKCRQTIYRILKRGKDEN